jgi:hypothetical protein
MNLQTALFDILPSVGLTKEKSKAMGLAVHNDINA